ncbi:MAG: alpha-1,3-rhamnosyltransferase [Paraglaciecola sp.]|jgi:alpha-1,3-rhamnosyltransferase
MNYPLVTVVVPSYNHVDYVTRCINSIMQQTYKSFEVVVIDDGSSDGTVELISALSIKHGFTFVSQKNAGVCKTLNRAVNEFSNGEYIAILASDDYWDLTKLEKQIAAIDENEHSEFCFTQALEFDSETDKSIRVFPSKPLSGSVLNQVFIRQHVPAGSMLFSRNLFDKLGGFDENLREEDWDFVIRSAAVTQFTNVAEPLFMYRSHDSNIMKTMGRRQIFKQKMLILSKNYMLVPPYVWLKSTLIHFIYDHLAVKVSNFRFFKRFL